MTIVWPTDAAGLGCCGRLNGLPDGALKASRHAESPTEFGVSIEFRDAAGRVWRRDEAGQLSFLRHEVHGGVATEAGIAQPITVKQECEASRRVALRSLLGPRKR